MNDNIKICGEEIKLDTLKNSDVVDIVIIGAGPAGMTAGIYAQRGKAKVVIIDILTTGGGKMLKTAEIENYPGLNRITGQDLSETMTKHLDVFLKEVKGEFITGAEVYNIGELVIDKNHYKYVCYYDKYRKSKFIVTKTIIIATGSRENRLVIPNSPYAEIFENKGISYCATCEAYFYKDNVVAVVGGGYSALQEAVYLNQIVKKVYLIHRRNEFRADQAIVDKVKQHVNKHNNKIEIITPYVVDDLEIEHIDCTVSKMELDSNNIAELSKNDNHLKCKIHGIIVKHVESELDKKTIAVAAVFVYIGALPNTNFLPKNIKDRICAANGYIKVNEDFSTAIPGIFAAGDVVDKKLPQIITAASDGANAAQSAINFINFIAKNT